MALLALAACAPPPAGGATPPSASPSSPAAAPSATPAEAQFEIEAGRDVEVRPQFQDGAAKLVISSPTGIGNARVMLVEGEWPRPLLLRLRLRGLEEFRFQYGDVTVYASLTAGPPAALRQAVTRDVAEEEPIDASSPYWLELSMPGAADVSAIQLPLEGDAVIELQPPADFYAAAPAEFEISWVDFFRG